MPNIVISVEHLSKQYDLGVIGTGTLSHDVQVFHLKDTKNTKKNFLIFRVLRDLIVPLWYSDLIVPLRYRSKIRT